MTRSCLLMVLLMPAGPAIANPGRVRVGLQAAFAMEQGNFLGSGPSSHTRLFMLQPQLSVAVVRKDKQPVLELINELTVAKSVRPLNRLIVSLNEGLRFHVYPTRKIGGYLELGAGIGTSALHTDPSIPRNHEDRQDQPFRQLDGWLQFHLQIGAGLRVSVPQGSLHAGYRMTHFSNNGTQLPNLGLNLHTVLIGYTTRPF